MKRSPHPQVHCFNSRKEIQASQIILVEICWRRAGTHLFRLQSVFKVTLRQLQHRIHEFIHTSFPASTAQVPDEKNNMLTRSQSISWWTTWIIQIKRAITTTARFTILPLSLLSNRSGQIWSRFSFQSLAQFMGSTYQITCMTLGQWCCEVLKLQFCLISMYITQEVNVT